MKAIIEILRKDTSYDCQSSNQVISFMNKKIKISFQLLVVISVSFYSTSTLLCQIVEIKGETRLLSGILQPNCYSDVCELKGGENFVVVYPSYDEGDDDYDAVFKIFDYNGIEIVEDNTIQDSIHAYQRSQCLFSLTFSGGSHSITQPLPPFLSSSRCEAPA